jgi:hypothetical protein
MDSSTCKKDIANQIKKKLDKQDKLAIKFYNIANFMMLKYASDAPFFIKIFLKILKLYQALNPHFCIKSSGPFFFKFREKIINEDPDWIKTCDFKSQKQDWEEMLNSSNMFIGKEIISGNIHKIVDHVKLVADKIDKKKGIELSSTFLKWYCEYSILQQEIILLSS